MSFWTFCLYAVGFIVLACVVLNLLGFGCGICATCLDSIRQQRRLNAEMKWIREEMKLDEDNS